MDLRQWLRDQHDDLGRLTERTIWRVIARDVFGLRPGGTGNSLVWLLWHVARVEDVAINGIVRG